MNHSKVVSRDEWLAARKQHLKKEKEFTRLRDKLSAERRASCRGSRSKRTMCSTGRAAKRRSPTFSTGAAN